MAGRSLGDSMVLSQDDAGGWPDLETRWFWSPDGASGWVTEVVLAAELVTRWSWCPDGASA